MDKYLSIISDSYSGYLEYLVKEISSPGWHNYFYWLIALSLIVWIVEIIAPWRKEQSIFRRDFWLDLFYVFFNFFIFPLILFKALGNLSEAILLDSLSVLKISNLVLLEVRSFPYWIQLLLMLVFADFIQWNIHRLLHRSDLLWNFHKVHHSVKEMGFAAHLRFHWMETIIYRTVQYLPLAIIGFGVKDFFVLHIFTVAIGHLNHANLNWSYGPLKYILNNPKMHIWHHAKHLPKEYRYGVNFGITFSLWDYVFGTAYIPENGRDIELGFYHDEDFPAKLLAQLFYPIGTRLKFIFHSQNLFCGFIYLFINN